MPLVGPRRAEVELRVGPDHGVEAVLAAVRGVVEVARHAPADLQRRRGGERVRVGGLVRRDVLGVAVVGRVAARPAQELVPREHAAAAPPPRLADAAPPPGAPEVGAAYEGDFLAEYGAHGKELVTLSLEDGVLAGVKVSGDDHVPAGETSFACDAAASKRSTGRIRVAGPGFSNPTWRDVDAVAVSRDELVLESRTEPVRAGQG